MTPVPQSDGRATIKDVIEITGRVETKLDAVAARLDTFALANENRFTRLEVTAESHDRRLDKIEQQAAVDRQRVDGVESRQGKDEAATRALETQRARVVDWRHWAVGAVLTLILALAAILPLVLK